MELFHARDESADVALRDYSVSRETRERLNVLVGELGRWQRVKNLVGPRTLAEVWTRHVADSIQLVEIEPAATIWLDLGSGAGFPGLVIAASIADTVGARVHCVEANSRKCAFLRHAARVMHVPVVVHDARIEDLVATFADVDVVTARALAPLSTLLSWTAPLLKNGTIGLFPKGETADVELTQARECLRFDVQQITSRTDSRGKILRIRGLSETARP